MLWLVVLVCWFVAVRVFVGGLCMFVFSGLVVYACEACILAIHAHNVFKYESMKRLSGCREKRF